MKRAQEEYERGDYDKALKFYNDVIKLEPNLAEAYYGIGLTYYQKRDIEKAIENFRKARELKPELVEAYYQEALIWHLMGRDKLQDAVPLYQKALELRPEFREARINLGDVYEKLGMFKEAVELYREGVKLHPNDPEMKEALQRAETNLSQMGTVEATGTEGEPPQE